MAKENRFIIRKEPTGFMKGSINIIVDKQTGAQYLYYMSGYGAGLCPLINEEGKPLLDKAAERPAK